MAFLTSKAFTNDHLIHVVTSIFMFSSSVLIVYSVCVCVQNTNNTGIYISYKYSVYVFLHVASPKSKIIIEYLTISTTEKLRTNVNI